MSKIVRSVFVRVCGAFGIFESRRPVRLPLSISLAETVSPGRLNQVCEGHTRDISSTGLSFVLPTTHINNCHIFSEGRALRIRLELPDGSVDMNAAPVRYDLFDARDNERRYLVGAQILSIKGDDRTRFIKFLRTAAYSPNVAAQIRTTSSATALPHRG